MRQRSNTFFLLFAIVTALSLVTAAIAMAATIIGDNGPNNLTGTDQRDRISPEAATTRSMPWPGPIESSRVRATTPSMPEPATTAYPAATAMTS